MNFLTAKKKDKLRDINSYILIIIAFSIPISVAFVNILLVLIILNWVFIANFKEDWKELKNNKVVWAVFIYVAISFFGLLWTNSLEFGLGMFKKDIKFLLIPIFMLFVKKAHIKYYIYAFLTAMTISEILSYSIYFEIIPPFNHATVYDPTPFLFHTKYNPLLTMSIYILLFYTLLSNTLNKKQKIIYSFFIITMSINMFITGGRAGQVMYFAMIIVVLFQYFEKQRLKAIIFSIFAIPLILTIAYNSSSIFHNRVNKVYTDISEFQTNKDTSVGNRINLTVNSWEIIKENPIIGVGTGGFVNSYKEVHMRLTPEATTLWSSHPHNMYILKYVELGILGLFSLLLILIIPVVQSIKSKDKIIRNLGVTMPLLFALIMLSDTYLLANTTTIFFVLFSSFLYKDYNSQKTQHKVTT